MKKESKESTSAGASGAFVAPLGMKQETNEKWSEKYKKSIDCNNPKGFSQRAHCQGKKKKLKENLDEAERTYLAKLRDLAKKYAQVGGKDSTSKEKIEKVYQELKKQFSMGINVEKEHKSGNPRQIALDHLSEDPKYYSKLKKIEKPKKVEAKESTSSASSGSYEGPAFGAKSMSPKDWRGAAKPLYKGGEFVTIKEKCKTFPYCNQGPEAINLIKKENKNIIENIYKNIAEKYGVDKNVVRNIILKELSKK